MWEEDPRWQQANYRFIVGCVVSVTVLATFSSLYTRDWNYLLWWLYALGTIFAALCLYASVVWSVCQIVRFGIRMVHRFWERKL